MEMNAGRLLTATQATVFIVASTAQRLSPLNLWSPRQARRLLEAGVENTLVLAALSNVFVHNSGNL
jgi:hypothetical protein